MKNNKRSTIKTEIFPIRNGHVQFVIRNMILGQEWVAKNNIPINGGQQ